MRVRAHASYGNAFLRGSVCRQTEEDALSPSAYVRLPEHKPDPISSAATARDLRSGGGTYFRFAANPPFPAAAGIAFGKEDDGAIRISASSRQKRAGGRFEKIQVGRK